MEDTLMPIALWCQAADGCDEEAELGDTLCCVHRAWEDGRARSVSVIGELERHGDL